VSSHAREPLDPDGILGAVLDALVEPVIVVGPDGVIQRANAAAVQVLGAERDVGRPIACPLPSTRSRARWPSARRSSGPSCCSTSTGARSPASSTPCR
jgi:PAS domain-containing protein